MKLVVIVNGQKFELDIKVNPEREDSYLVNCNGEEIPIEIVETKPTSITLGIGGSIGFFEFIRRYGVLKEVIHSGRSYEVEVKSPRQVELENLLEKYRTSSAGPSVEKVIIAPMPGKILDIYVKPGDKVELGQVVGVLEAMKMENEIGSTVEGIVKEVKLKKGDNVALNQVIIELV